MQVAVDLVSKGGGLPVAPPGAHKGPGARAAAGGGLKIWGELGPDPRQPVTRY